MDYFPQLPVIGYPSLTASDRKSNYVMMTNILSRSAFIREITENSAIFYEYQVKDQDTPEIIAAKLYGDPKRFWIVLLFNQLNNPLYDFPLPYNELEGYIEAKYNTSIANTQTEIHHYEQRITKNIYFNDVLQTTNTSIITISSLQQNVSTGIAETTPFLPGTADTTLSVSETTETFDNGISVIETIEHVAISTYNHEVTLNEHKRTVKLLDKAYIGAVEAEMKRITRNG